VHSEWYESRTDTDNHEEETNRTSVLGVGWVVLGVGWAGGGVWCGGGWVRCVLGLTCAYGRCALVGVGVVEELMDGVMALGLGALGVVGVWEWGCYARA
jgi:hypothetical protein